MLKARLGPLLSPPTGPARVTAAMDKENASARGRVTEAEAPPSRSTLEPAPAAPKASTIHGTVEAGGARSREAAAESVNSPPLSRDAFLSGIVEDGVRTPLNMLIRAPAGMQQHLRGSIESGEMPGSHSDADSRRLLSLRGPLNPGATSPQGGSPGDGGAVTLNELVKLKAAAEAAAASASAGTAASASLAAPLAAYQRYAERMATYLSAQLSHSEDMKVRGPPRTER